MFRKKTQRKRVRLLPLALAFQFMAPVHAMAEVSKYSKASQTIDTTMKYATQFLQAHQQRMQQMQAQRAMQQFQQNLSLKPVDPSQVPPIFSQNGCMVLPARTDNVSKSLQCEERFDINTFNAGLYDSMFSVAEQNVNDIENFLTEGHQRFTTQGAGCYTKARNQLFQQLNARAELLEGMKEALSNQVERFKKATEKERLEIKKADALLNGTGKADKQIAAAIKDFKFESKFGNKACQSLLLGKSPADFEGLGSAGGLRGIEEALQKNHKDIGAETFFSSKQDFEREIREIASEAAKQTRRDENFTDANKVLGSIRTRKIPNNSLALVTSFNIAKTRAENETSALKQDIQKVVGSDKALNGIVGGIGANSIQIDEAIEMWERDTKNACLKREIARSDFGSVDGLASALFDPNESRKANEESDSPFKNFIKKILSDDRLTVEEKMKRIDEEQSKNSNKRYIVTLGTSASVGGKKVGASTRLRGRDLVNLFGNECVAAFKHDKMGSGSTGKDAVKALKKYASGIQKVRKNYASEVQQEIVDGMLTCSTDTSTGKAPATCGANSLDPAKAGFCVRTANACASNALACADDAKKLVENVRGKQVKMAENYKKKMDNLKVGMIAEFKSVKAQMEQSSRMIDGMYQMGTAFKKNEKPLEESMTLNFTDTELMKGMDPSLMMEDPDLYLAKVVKNIDGLKKQVEDHRQQMMKGIDDEIKKYKDNMKKQLAYWKGLQDNCYRKVTKEYTRFMDEQDRMNAEADEQYNEELSNACSPYKDFKSNPCPAGESSKFGELAGSISDLGRMSADPSAQAAAGEISQIVAACDSFSNENGFNTYDPTGGNGSSVGGKYSISFSDFCGVNDAGEKGPGADSTQCQRYNALGDATQGGRCDLEKLLKAKSKSVCVAKSTSGVETYEIGNKCEKEAILSNLKKPDIEELVAALDSNCDQESLRSGSDQIRKDAQELYLSYKRYGLKEKAGQIQVAACESQMNGGPGMPDMGQYGEQRGVAGQMPGMFTIGQ